MRFTLLFAVLLFASDGVYAADPFAKCLNQIPFGLPTFTAGQHDHTPLCRLGYALLHDNNGKIAYWAAWHLTKAHATSYAARKDAFEADPDLPAGERAELSDYRASSFDREHLAPNADFNWSVKAARQSFYLSNMTPQIHAFNGGIWKRLEEFERLWATDRKEVYVIAGPIFDDHRARTIEDGYSVFVARRDPRPRAGYFLCAEERG